MSNFISNSQVYNIVTESELAEILSHYDSELIFTVVKDAMDKRFINVPIVPPPNVVGAWEQNFKSIQAQYGSESIPEVQKVRLETYKEIIDIICKEYNLNFTVADVDQFAATYQLYDFFICNFSNNITDFFAKYIYKERNAIYESMGLAEMKKNKDSSTIYGKKIYKDIKLAVINACIDRVIYNICGMEFDLYSIINIVAGSRELAQYLIDMVSSNSDFFKDVFVQIMNSDIAPLYQTNIRFRLQEIAMAHEQTNVVELDSESGGMNE